MILDVFPNHICRHLVVKGARKISIFPKLSTPQLFLDLKVLEDDAGTDTPEYPNQLRYGVLRRKGQKSMDIVLTFEFFI